MDDLRAAMHELYGGRILGMLHDDDVLKRLLAAGYTGRSSLQEASFDEMWAIGLPDAMAQQLHGPKLLRAAGVHVRWCTAPVHACACSCTSMPLCVHRLQIHTLNCWHAGLCSLWCS